MERNLLFVLFVMLFCVCGCFSQNTIVQDGVVYTLRYSEKKNEVLVTGYQGSPSSVIIADSITFVKTKYPVTTLKYQAFKDCSTLMYIELPDCLTEIQGSVFDGCTKLSSIVIPENDTIIGDGAFQGCSSLKNITIPRNVQEVRASAFRNCTSLSSVLFNAERCAVEWGSFGGCPIKKIIFGDYVRYISSNCCADMKNLTSVVIPDGVESIGKMAFAYCENLASIEIPESIKRIEGDVFYGCTSLKTIYWNAIECSDLTSAFFGNETVERFIFGDGVKSIPAYCCCSMKALTSIKLPSGVSKIGQNAFSGCSSLTSIEIPNGVTSIGKTVFKDCTRLKTVNWNAKDCENVPSDAFNGCTVEDFIFGPDVKSIPSYCCYKMGGLVSIGLPQNLLSIGEFAFSECTELISITIPNNVTIVGNAAFKNCNKLKNVRWYAEECEDISSDTFSGCPIKNVIFGENVRRVPSYCCYNMSGLTSIELPDVLLSIGDYAFSGCSGIASIEIPKGVTSIGKYAFENCSSNGSVIIPNGVQDIKDGVFKGCTELSTIKITDGVEAIGGSAFDGCSRITSLTLPLSVSSVGTNAFQGMSSLDTLIISNPQAQIPYYSKALYNMSLKYFVAPANALAVEESDLSNTTSSIKTLVVNGGELNDECFAFINRQRKALTRLDMSGAENLSIADEAFLDSYKLEDVILPDNTVSIGYKSFSGCISLKSITIPKHVASIGYGAYSDCEDVEYIYCAAATPPTIKSNTFSNVRKDIPVYVPCESIELYNAAGGWSDFTNIQCIQEAEPVDDPIDEPVVDPDHTSVEITWPVSFDADKYVINVMLGGKIFCTLTFNEKGLLLSIEYANGDPSSRSAELRAAIPTAGYKFTIKGLTEGTEYTYTVDAVNALGSVIEEYEGSFKTLGDTPTDVTEASANKAKVTGVYNLAGQPVPASTPGLKIITYSDGTAVKKY